MFADFDNDGDSDVFIGRTMARSLYLENQGGRFVDRSEAWTDRPLPMLVSSVSAVDYDGDGLLDVYVSTYASDAMRSDLATLRQKTQIPNPRDEREALIFRNGPLAVFLSARGRPAPLRAAHQSRARLSRLPQRVRAAQRPAAKYG